MKAIARSIAALLLGLCLTAPGFCQPPTGGEPAASLGGSGTAEKTGPNPAPGYVLCFLSTALVLFIVCKPVRKT
jgi:hypothetical protein